MNNVMAETFDRMKYETLIRTGLDCTRGKYEGANADIFDSLCMKQIQYDEDKSLQKSFELGLSMGIVITWMRDAIQKLHDRYSDNVEIREELNECLCILSEPLMKNIEIAGLKALKAVGRNF